MHAPAQITATVLVLGSMALPAQSGLLEYVAATLESCVSCVVVQAFAETFGTRVKAIVTKATLAHLEVRRIVKQVQRKIRSGGESESRHSG